MDTINLESGKSVQYLAEWAIEVKIKEKEEEKQKYLEYLQAESDLIPRVYEG